MINLRKLGLTLALLTPMAAQATYISTFADKGDLVTEIRDYGDYTETWEWLDLGITRNISVNTIKEDLADNNTIDGLLYENSLSDADLKGWQTVTLKDVGDMVNQYFGLAVNFQYDVTTTKNISLVGFESIVEDFIITFGDSYHAKSQNTYGVDANPDLPNIGYVSGWTDLNEDTGYGDYLRISDGQYFNAISDNYDDSMSFWANFFSGDERSDTNGVWLNRQVLPDDSVVAVPEPANLAWLGLGLIGWLSHVRKRKS